MSIDHIFRNKINKTFFFFHNKDENSYYVQSREGEDDFILKTNRDRNIHRALVVVGF